MSLARSVEGAEELILVPSQSISLSNAGFALSHGHKRLACALELAKEDFSKGERFERRISSRPFSCLGG